MSYRLITVFAATTFAGCIIPAADDVAPCDASGSCLPGYACYVGYCMPVDESSESVGIGPEGGEIVGLDGTRIVFPPGALTERVEFAIAPVAAAVSLDGLEVLSETFIVQPQDVVLQSPVMVMVPVPEMPADKAGHACVMISGADGWIPLMGHGELNWAMGSTTQLGVFTAAMPHHD